VSEAPEGARQGTYKVGKPYQIQGVWYYPSEDYTYDETGVASWYGPDFHGKFTANGEIFDQNDVTAAHRTLPMPCFVRVTNLENGRSLVVRINDRGPFAHGRILDLSRRAAEMLDIQLNGTARVHVQILAEESQQLALQMKSADTTALAASPRAVVQAEPLAAPPGKAAPASKTKTAAKVTVPVSTPAVATESVTQDLADQVVHVQPTHPTQLFIQTGAFSHYDNARRMSTALSNVGSPTITEVRKQSSVLYRVRLGPIGSLDDADALLEHVLSAGFPDAKLIVD
jgi:rare lipoprotein A